MALKKTFIFLFLLFSYVFGKRDESLRSKKNRTPTTTVRTAVGDAVVEKFVETLMASERYWKQIETVERKLNHLDATFHEKTNSILKYMSEMLRLLKASPAEALEKALTDMKSDLDRLKQTVTTRLDEHPSLRSRYIADGGVYNFESSLGNRLSSIETNVKTIMSGLDTIVATMSEVKSRQFSRTFNKPTEIGSSLDTMSMINEFRKIMHEQRSKKCDCKGTRVDRSERYPTDCHEIQMQGFNVSGIYKIRPEDMEPFYILCDLTTAGGGWTVFQNRYDGSQDFYKGWSDYKYGFGNLAGEFWLGLDKLNFLTNQKLYELRVEVETQHGQDAYAGYSVFTLGPEHEGYRMSTLGTYYGTAGDSLSYHAGQKFSTPDMDNDEWKDGSCASEHGGAWWYKECDKSNLNGKYSTTGEENKGQSVYWISFKSPNSPLTKTKMMIRPLPATRPVDIEESNRKTSETVNLRPIPEKVKVRPKETKSTYDLSHNHQQYRYEDPGHVDAFFPGYAR